MLSNYPLSGRYLGFCAQLLTLSVISITPLGASTLQPDPTEEHIALKRGDFVFHRYLPGGTEFKSHPQAIIIFGSGDGGPCDWEDRVCKHLQSSGCEILSFDCAEYAKTDYDLSTLQTDAAKLAQSALVQYGVNPPPLILGGWSMGAEQAVPMAGGPDRPKGVVGLLLISPGARGRYGLRDADRWDVPPTGQGTFAMADFAHDLNGLRVVQWDAETDLPKSDNWLKSLSAVHQGNIFSAAQHDYNGANDAFLADLDRSVAWILSPSPSRPLASLRTSNQ